MVGVAPDSTAPHRFLCECVRRADGPANFQTFT